jgi:uncharacterized protein (TIGR02246 family)
MKWLITIVWITMIATTVGCNRGADRQADTKMIHDLERKWNEDFASRDAGKLASYYEEDAVLMPPGAPPSVGRESIRATLKQMLADPGLTLKFAAAQIDVAQSGELGYTRGAYVMTLTDPVTKNAIQDHGSYVTTYRKDPDGSWRVAADIATSDARLERQ